MRPPPRRKPQASRVRLAWLVCWWRLEVGVNCHNPKAECDGSMRPLSAKRLLFIRQHFSEWSRCAVYVHDSGNTAATDCRHRFDESSARFAAPCLRWHPGGLRCASC